MVAGYHLIFSAYAAWLPNDPRGSSSHEIRADILSSLGDLHPGRKRIQPVSAVIRAFYDTARPLLKHPLLTFNDSDVRAIAASFAAVIQQESYTCYACAIMLDHVHILIRKHRHRAEDMIAHLQTASRDRLILDGSRTPDHPVWGGPGWRVFLDSRDDMDRTVRYIAANPIKANRPAQAWEFVQKYNGWLPGVGASARGANRAGDGLPLETVD